MDNDLRNMIALLIWSLVLIIGAGITVSKQTTAEIRNEAVKVGCAEYYIDKDFNKQFRWLPIKK